MQVAFDGVGSMPMQKIRDVRLVKQAIVDTEMQKRESRDLERRSREASATGLKAAPVDGESSR